MSGTCIACFSSFMQAAAHILLQQCNEKVLESLVDEDGQYVFFSKMSMDLTNLRFMVEFILKFMFFHNKSLRQTSLHY